MIKFSWPSNRYQVATIDVARLYPESSKRELFETRLREMLATDSDLREVLEYQSKKALVCKSVPVLPSSSGRRPRLLIIPGNPAPHSVRSNLRFAWEGNKRPHRFWRALVASGIVSGEKWLGIISPREMNLIRSGAYQSPFDLAIADFFSVPTPTIGPWAGVAGLRRLFGTQAFAELANAEASRIKELIATWTPNPTALLVLQRDAYERLRSTSSPRYAAQYAIDGQLWGSVADRPDVLLAGAAPTRLFMTQRAIKGLARIRKRIARDLSIRIDPVGPKVHSNPARELQT